MNDQDIITAEFIPPPAPAPGKIVVKAPADRRGNPVFSTLHLSPQQAYDLWSALGTALEEAENAEPRVQGDTAH